MSKQFETRCIHGSGDFSFQEPTRAVSFPIYQSATFGHIGLGHSSGFDYTREKNPTRQHLEETVSALEGAVDTVAFTSGMAAVSACFELFAPGDHILCSEDLYGGVIRLQRVISGKNGVTADYVDTTDLSALQAAIRPNTKALYIETPSNPMMNITDLRACAALAKERGLLLIVDNTFLSPYLQNPIALGADIVLHSGSKFLSGHNDTISGFLCSANQELADRVRLIAKTTGGTLSPFDCWLTRQPQITQVFYAGLPDHPGYAVNAGQARGAGSMISFRTDTADTAKQVLEKVRLITFAESLGGTESLITYPMVQTHPDVPQAMREHLGITDTLLRLSVGLEHVDDIIADLAQALGAAS
jgi:cystathionine gamma-synthase